MTKKEKGVKYRKVQKFMEDLHIQAQNELTNKTRRTCGNFNSKK